MLVTRDQVVEDAVKAALDELDTDVPHHMVQVKFGYTVVKKDVAVTSVVTSYDKPLLLSYHPDHSKGNFFTTILQVNGITAKVNGGIVDLITTPVPCTLIVW